MIIAIASTGGTINSKLDKRFARCSFFALYNTISGEINFIKNFCQTMDKDAGLAVVECLHKMNVKKIISGEFGIKIKEFMDNYNIQMIIMPEQNQTINEIVKLLKANK
ncbi:MAG TPA: NifB/NifX family molybdenum-iron cluster-binding protein [Bacteroidales bacterium]|nr:NifB/NifX family molybdenum-iron cluster-binding protein [Bacteroidales bacterium]HPS17773.1 NifB/NifX family molybdenum-iron cluster-binding protein [Bacteroidales bacterium]